LRSPKAKLNLNPVKAAELTYRSLKPRKAELRRARLLSKGGGEKALHRLSIPGGQVFLPRKPTQAKLRKVRKPGRVFERGSKSHFPFFIYKKIPLYLVKTNHIIDVINLIRKKESKHSINKII